MDRHQLKVMINKEYRELVNDRGLMFSLLIIPIIFSIVLPILLFILGTRKEVSASIVGLNTFIEQFKMIKYPDYLTRGTVPFYVIFTYFLVANNIIPAFFIFANTIASHNIYHIFYNNN